MIMKRKISILFFMCHVGILYCQRIEEYTQCAIEKINLKDYEAAVGEITKIIGINPVDSMAYFDRGLIKNDFLKAYQSAIKDFTMAIKIDSSNVDAYYYRGMSNYHLKLQGSHFRL